MLQDTVFSFTQAVPADTAFLIYGWVGFIIFLYVLVRM